MGRTSPDRNDAVGRLRSVLAPDAAGSGEQQQFAVVPLSRRDSFLVPLRSRAVARKSLTEYAALRTLPKRLVRHVVGAAWVTGLPEHVFRGRATLPTGDETLVGHLREVLDDDELTFATGLRWVGSFFTPVLQLFGRDAAPVGYAKIGWDDVTRQQVRAESDALRLVARNAPQVLHAPGLLHAGSWHDLELCVTAPLPKRARRVPRSQLPPVAPLPEVGALDGPLVTSTLRTSAWWRALADEAPDLEPRAPGLVDALGRLDGEIGTMELQFGRWHGDWVAWNMASAPDGLYVWDWEYSRPNVPFGMDLLHFFFQDAFVLRGVAPMEAFSFASEQAADGLRRLGFDAEVRTALGRLHRLEVRVRAERAVARGADAEPGLRDPPISTLLAHS